MALGVLSLFHGCVLSPELDVGKPLGLTGLKEEATCSNKDSKNSEPFRDYADEPDSDEGWLEEVLAILM